jgi:hypothetical protein
MFQTLKHSTRTVLPVLVLSLVLTCEDRREKYSSVKIQIVMTSGTNTNSGQNNRITGALLSDVTNITITISGVEPVNVNVTSGATVTQTIDGVSLGEQTVKIDLKDAGGIILYTQTQTVTVEAGKTASPTFPADDFTAENVEIELTSPNGGEAWELGTTQSITWTTSHSSENVAITLYKNSASYQVLSAATASTGSYSWTIPDSYDAGSDYKVRISSVSDATVSDDSDSNFTLTSASQPTITVTSPNGGEDWELGSAHNITWSSSDVSGNVRIDLFKWSDLNNLLTFIETLSSDESNDGSYNWTISSELDAGTDYLVHIRSLNSIGIYDYTDAYFTLSTTPTTPTITVTSPNGGEDWELGSAQDITWSSVNVSGNVKIELYKAGSVEETLSSDESNDGSYSWTISSELDAGSDYKIKISSLDNLNIYDESDAYFTLSTTPTTPTITVTSPNGGEDWELGSAQDITWSSVNVSGNVKIELYKAGSVEETLSSDESNDGSYSWTISSELDAGSDYKIRISSLVDLNVFDESDQPFTLSENSENTDYSLAFSGNDYIEFPDNQGDGNQTNLDFGGNFTIQFLIKITSNHSINIIGKDGGLWDGGYSVSYTPSGWSGNPELLAGLSDDDGNSCSGIFRFYSGTLENYLNTWLSVSIGHSSSLGYLNIHVNGIETDYTNLGGCEVISNPNNSNPLYVGSSSSNGSSNFIMNKVIMWGRYLNTNEILNNLTLDMIDNPEAWSMRAYWAIDEGLGNTISDDLHEGQTGYNGTIYGAEWTDDIP